MEEKKGSDFGKRWTNNFLFIFLLNPGPGMEKSAESEACRERKTKH